MASSLASQLAQIAAKSTNELNLKAQRAAHSQSLIFDRAVAASQSFETIHQICYEGFRELCLLEPKFVHFERNLFSDQSKTQDRTQLTAEQNRELDTVVEAFLGLIGPKLLLKPAVKAVEWLFRRFRIHEYNTSFTLLTFLPYHTTPVFRNLLSLIPKTLPSDFRFLHPYVQGLSNPPRHVIVYSATTNDGFFSSFNNYILRICDNKSHSHAFLSFWAGAITEAVSERFDLARSGRREVQERLEEDLLLKVLPPLDRGLTFRKIPEMTLACCMIAIIIASKGAFSDKVLDGLMEAIARAMDEETSQAGIASLSILAARKETFRIPNIVVNRVCEQHKILRDVGQQYDNSALALCMINRCLETAQKRETDRIEVVGFIFKNNMLSETHLSAAVLSVLEAVKSVHGKSDIPSVIKDRFAGLVQMMQQSDTTAPILQQLITKSAFDVGALEQDIQHVVQSGPAVQSDIQMEINDAALGELSKDFESMIAHVPERAVDEHSFLNSSRSHLFSTLLETFLVAAADPSDVQKFSALPVLRRGESPDNLLFNSFMIRVSCGPYPIRVKVAALQELSRLLDETSTKVDAQLLIPYAIVALTNSTEKIRREASNLLLSIGRASLQTDGLRSTQWLTADLYDLDKGAEIPYSLSADDAAKFLRRGLLPILEECILDPTYAIRGLASIVNGPTSALHKPAKTDGKDLKKMLRQNLFTYLSGHIASTPLWSVRLTLLEIVNQVDRTAQTSHGRELLQWVLHDWAVLSPDTVDLISQEEKVDGHSIDQNVVSIILPMDKDCIAKLLSTLMVDGHSARPGFVAAVFDRIKQIWSSMKVDRQLAGAEHLLDIALAQTPEHRAFSVACRDVLRSITMPTEVILHVIDKAHDLTSTLAEQSPHTKRRRLSQNQMVAMNMKNQTEIVLAISRLTFVLEIVDSSRPEFHPELLARLFQTLAVLHHLKSQAQSELAYPLTLVLGCLLAIVNRLEVSSVSKLDANAVRTDLVIDCVRTTDSPQVQNNALLLIASLAKLVPDLVLHSVMPIFTFMGSTLLRKDDDYSAHVIDHTIDRVIPPLIQSLRVQKRDVISGTSDLLLSFTAAFEHIPHHRRLRLFQTLIAKLGPEDFLFAVLAMLASRYAGNGDVRTFIINLVSQFHVELQLQAFDKYLELVMDALKPNPVQSKLILGLGNEDGNDQESIVYALLHALSSLLAAKELKTEVKNSLHRNTTRVSAVQNLFTRLVEQIFLLSDMVKRTKKLDTACNDVLGCILDLLPFDELLNTMRRLLEQQDVAFRRRILKLLERRLRIEKAKEASAQIAAINFLPVLSRIVEDDTDRSLQQAAVSSIAQISRRFGKKQPESVLTVASVIAGPSCLGQNDNRLSTTGLLCLASMIGVLGQSFIPLLPKTMNKIFQLLRTSMTEAKEDRDLYSASYALLNALLAHIPWMISDQYLDHILASSFESIISKIGDEEEAEAQRNKALECLAEKTEPAETFKALDRNWAKAVSNGPEAVQEVLRVLNHTIETHAKSAVVKSSEILSNILLQAFDLRRQWILSDSEDVPDESDISEIEDLTNEVAIKMIYKMNDSVFRPIFRTAMDWATDGLPQHDCKGLILRKMSLYSFLLKFFDDLKSIVTSYSAHIIDSVRQVLISEQPIDATFQALWAVTVRMLTAAFEHDQDEFWQNPSHFNAISGPLLAQLSKGSSKLPIQSGLIPAITALAATADSPDHHKAMNLAIIKYKDSQEAAVRLAAVKCQQSLTERLGEEWLAHSAEMMVFINDLLEDDDEEVERETRRWVLKIEEVLGEDIEALLQG